MDPLSRRRLVRLGGAAVITGLAGCGESEDDEGGEGDGGEGDDGGDAY